MQIRGKEIKTDVMLNIICRQIVTENCIIKKKSRD
jgi:hypothetical protein